MLTDRQKNILWTIVDFYILSAEPISSRAVAKKSNLDVSAATVRNEMSDLEAMGFLKQPHTSAGRIPSQKGYRFYVDNILPNKHWTRQAYSDLQADCFSTLGDMEEVFKHSTLVLSRLTQCLTILLGPDCSESRIVHLQLILLSKAKALSILVTDCGQVYQQRVLVPQLLDEAILLKLVHFLNMRLKGLLVVQLNSLNIRELAVDFTEKILYIDMIEHVINQMLSEQNHEQFYTSGAKQMLLHPEFQDISKIKTLLYLIEEDNLIMRLLSSSERGINVRIGYENDISEVQDFSVITASYQVNDEITGTIGVIGPMRMDYGRIISLIDWWAEGFSVWLKQTTF